MSRARANTLLSWRRPQPTKPANDEGERAEGGAERDGDGSEDWEQEFVLLMASNKKQAYEYLLNSYKNSKKAVKLLSAYDDDDEARLRCLQGLPQLGIEEELVNLTISILDHSPDNLPAVAFLQSMLSSRRAPDVSHRLCHLLKTYPASTDVLSLVTEHVPISISMPTLFVIVPTDPLPRLGLTPAATTPVDDALTKMLSGAYAAMASRTLKFHLATSLGALRTLRLAIRRTLQARLARAYISREASVGYSHSGAPGHLDVEGALIEGAWARDVWGVELRELGSVQNLHLIVRGWVKQRDEQMLEEVCGLLRDVFVEIDAREEDGVVEEMFGKVLNELIQFIKPIQIKLPLSTPSSAPSPLLISLCTLLSTAISIPNLVLTPSLSYILLPLSDHLTTADYDWLINNMLIELGPTHPDWLDNWDRVLQIPTQTTRVALRETYNLVRDMPCYRRRLGDKILAAPDPDYSLISDELLARYPDDAELIKAAPVVALIHVFTARLFAEDISLWDTLLSRLSTADTPSRLVLISFLMHLRADRDHRVYWALHSIDEHAQISHLYSLINRTPPLWPFPEEFPFDYTPWLLGTSLVRVYDPSSPVLPFSQYVTILTTLLENGDWHTRSLILALLPSQLANKHLFCGPRTRVAIRRLGQVVSEICNTPSPGRDMAFHTLIILIGYKHCFDLRERHAIVETFKDGLDGDQESARCALQALGLCTAEIPSSVTRHVRPILEKLSQIMSNLRIAVHLLSFLVVLAASNCHGNFRAEDYRIVFRLACQYLDLHRRFVGDGLEGGGEGQGESWALSQHVRIMSYYIIYVWFLNIKVPDRSQHIKYITRQLLLTGPVDDYSEVCFDWLARYTYASADPRPARTVLGDILLSPAKPTGSSSKNALLTKTWLLSNQVLTVRALPRLGWFEVLSRRPSGLSQFLCRLENHPMVGPGEARSDRVGAAAVLLDGREGWGLPNVVIGEDEGEDEDEEEETLPDPITGYIWSGSAPSQRRKEVSVDPAFLALQLSAALSPSVSSEQHPVLIPPSPSLTRFTSSFDRIPVIDTHKVGVIYVGPTQTQSYQTGPSLETLILRNTHGSPAYTRFLSGLGRLIALRGQEDVYAGGLDPTEDGEYAYAWWDDIGQILFHVATLMPTEGNNEEFYARYSDSRDSRDNVDWECTKKKRHIGNDYVRIVWNESGAPYAFDTIKTEFNFVNVVIEPHSRGVASSTTFQVASQAHDTEHFRVYTQRTPGLVEFEPFGSTLGKLISAESLPRLVRQVALLSDWYASIFAKTGRDRERVEVGTNWVGRLGAVRRFKVVVERELAASTEKEQNVERDGNDGSVERDGKERERSREAERVGEEIMRQEEERDFTRYF